MKLIINEIEFELPSYCEIAYQADTNNTHIFFGTDVKFYEKIVNLICEVLNIERFNHELGITFGDCHIYWPGSVPPNGISILSPTKRPILSAMCEYGYPNLLNACAHSALATFHAKRYIKGMQKIGHMKSREISQNKGAKDRSRKIDKSRIALIAGELLGKL